MKQYSKIIGTGRYLPNLPISNAQLAEQLAQKGIETNDEWIRERTGIEQRYLAASDQTSSELAFFASQSALEMAGITAQDLDLIIVATTTPDMSFPSTACLLQAKLGASGCAAFDVQAVCSGFVYAVATADSMIKNGLAKHALVVGAETMSRIIDWQDRTTCVLFGDGAGAMVLTQSETAGVLSNALHAKGELYPILHNTGYIAEGQLHGHPFLSMQGQAVYKQAVTALADVAIEVLQKGNLPIEQLDWIIPHQANIRILQATAKRLDIPWQKVIVTVNQHANTSAASVPMAMDIAVRDGRIKSGQTVMLQGVGGGFTWGANLVRWLA